MAPGARAQVGARRGTGDRSRRDDQLDGLATGRFLVVVASHGGNGRLHRARRRLDRHRWGKLRDCPDDDSAEAREGSRLYNTSTLVTLTVGVLICYLALYVVNLVWALFVLDPAVMGGYLDASLGYGDLFVLAWFVASAATVGGGLGTGLEADEAIRAATYSKREEEAPPASRAQADLDGLLACRAVWWPMGRSMHRRTEPRPSNLAHTPPEKTSACRDPRSRLKPGTSPTDRPGRTRTSLLARTGSD